MKTDYSSIFTSWICAVCLVLVCAFQVSAQNVEGVKQEVIRIKFKENSAARLEQMKPARTAEGYVLTGLYSVDQLNTQYRVKSFKRVFRHAGKFEEKHKKYGLHLWYELEVEKGVNTMAALSSYSRLSDVDIAEPVYEKYINVEPFSAKSYEDLLGTLPGPPNDPQFSAQWHYKNTGQGGGKVGADIGLVDAWQLETGSIDVIVAVTDGGIDVKHQDLAANMWINVNEIPNNGIDDDNNGYVDDINGYGFGDNSGAIPADVHGTHVGGTVSAVTNNNVGVAGVAGGSGSGDGVRLMSCAAFGAVGTGGFEETYIYAADNGAVISQNSWGYTQPNVFEQAVLDAIDYFIAEAGFDETGAPVGPMQGGIVIFAAGNSGSDNKWYPGYYEPVFAVAGTDRNDNRYTSSNFGSWVELAAPAVGVISTLPNNKYGGLTGTSMACPHVSGVAALIVSKFAGSITPQQVWDRLVETTDLVTTLPAGFGSGRLNAFNALQENDGQAPQPITDLSVDEVYQNAVKLSWTAPSDLGNGKASSYDLRYSTSPITEANFEAATKVPGVPPASAAGEEETFVVGGLASTTTYYFAIKSIDFFGNKSAISNIASATTENAPVISVSPDSFNVVIDVAKNPVATRTLTIANEGTGAALHFTLNATLVSQEQTRLLYPGSGLSAVDLSKYGVGNPSGVSEAKGNSKVRKSATSIAASINAVDSIFYDSGDNTAEDFAGLVSGDPYSTAVRFDVTEPNFKLTHIRNFFRTESLSNPTIIMEVYKGSSFDGSTLLLSQEVNVASEEGEFFVVPLEKSLDFTQGDVFWIVSKYPSGVSYPQGVDEGVQQRPNTFFFSSDGGLTFSPSIFIFKVRALSASSIGGSWISFDPASGTVSPGDSVDVTVAFNGGEVPNGNYVFNILVNSDDPNNPTLTVPAHVKVTGQQPDITIEDYLLEFGRVFVGAKATLPLVIKNTGFSKLVINNIQSSSLAFKTNIKADTLMPDEEVTIYVTFEPKFPGNISGTLTIGSNDPDESSFEIALVGVATSPPIIGVDPDEVHATLNAGEVGMETITITNYGNYPLTYSFPEIAARKLLENPSVQKNNTSRIESAAYSRAAEEKGSTEAEPLGHPVLLGAGSDSEFGYTWIDSETAGGPEFKWRDIKKTGTEINSNSDDGATEVSLPFQFEFYGEKKTTVKIGSNGYLTFGTNGTDYSNDQIPDAKEPNDIIAPFWDDLRPSSRRGKMYYKLDPGSLTVQYDSVGNYAGSGYGTFQVVLMANGKIYFYYKDVNGMTNRSSATIGIENKDASDGVQVVYNNSYVKDSLAVIIMPPAPEFITDAMPLTGVVPVNQSKKVKLILDATNLVDGVYAEDLLIESNDPVNSSLMLPVELKVIGTPAIAVEPNALAFDTVFITVSKTKEILIKNPGTKALVVDNVQSSHDDFTVNFDGPLTIEPKLGASVQVTFQPSSTGLIEGELMIISNVSDSGSLAIPLSGVGIEPPVISVSPDSIYAEVPAGEVEYDTLQITNSGAYRLDYSIASTFWFKPKPANRPSAAALAAYERIPEKGEADSRKGSPILNGGGNDQSFGYVWEDNKDGAGPAFDWTDITGKGTEVTDAIAGSLFADGAIQVPVGFKFNFYGTTYDSVNISANGLLYFGKQGSTITNRRIPVSDVVNNLIAGFWDDLEPGTIAGTVHYLSSSDKLVVQYTGVAAYGNTNQGTVTFQVILYPNGNIKLQYKDVSSANFLNKATVGIENAAGSDGVEVAFNNAYVQDGLAVLFTGPVTGSVAPGETESVPVALDARGLNDGTFTGTVRISSNDINNPVVEIPITLKVVGEPEIDVNPDTLNFGQVFVHADSVFSSTKEVVVKNTGTKELNVSSVFVTDSTAFKVSSDSSSFVLAPKASIKLSVTFSPNAVKSYAESLIFVSDDATDSLLHVSLYAEGVKPPVFTANTKGDTIVANLKSDGAATGIIKVKNSGGSVLTYNADVAYLSDGFGAKSILANVKTSKMRQAAVNAKIGLAGATPIVARMQQLANGESFSDSIAYESGNVADDFVGIPDPTIPFAAATKFVAPEGGFTLTHVRNLYRTEASSAFITMEIYRGGDNPGLATKIASQEVSGSSAEGEFRLISLNTPINFAAGQTFWVVFQYPESITYPQGINENVAGVEGIYWYSGDGGASWNAFENDLPGTAAKVRALQQGGATGWITITPESGEVAPGSSENISVFIDGSKVEGGDYYAKVNITTNDPFNPTASIPVKVHVNMLPQFEDVPDTLVVNENGKLQLTLKATDQDGKILIYTLKDTYPNVKFKSYADSAVFTFTPNFEQSGVYNFTVEALDNMKEKGSVSFIVKVNNVNRSPIIVKQIKRVVFDKSGEIEAIDLTTHIQDPDQDMLTYTVSAGDPSVVSVEMLDNVLLLTSLKKGSTFVSVIASDNKGSMVGTSFEVRVKKDQKAKNGKDGKGGTSSIVADASKSAQPEGLVTDLTNYPNPFSSETTIAYSLGEKSYVRLEVFSTTGQSLGVLVEGVQEAGEHRIAYKALSVPAGMYLYKLQVGDKVITKRMIRE